MATCLVGRWRAAHGDVARAERAVARLREMPGDLPAHCARLLEAWAATVARRPDALALARRLDADLRAVPPAWSETDNLTVARLLEANGDTAGALAAVQRRRVDLTPLFHSAYLREEARLARSVRGN